MVGQKFNSDNTTFTMPSLKKAPGAVDDPALPNITTEPIVAQEATVMEERKRDDDHKIDVGDVSLANGNNDQPTNAEEEMGDVKISSDAIEGRDDCDNGGTAAAACSDVAEMYPKNVTTIPTTGETQNGEECTTDQNQNDGLSESKSSTTDTAPDEEEPVFPHDLDSVNHNILGRYIAAPSDARAINLLYTHKDETKWDSILPAIHLPVLPQKRCIEIMRSKMNETQHPDANSSASPKSPWRALCQNNTNLAKKKLIPRDNIPHFHEQKPIHRNVTSTLHANAFPLQHCAFQTNKPQALYFNPPNLHNEYPRAKTSKTPGEAVLQNNYAQMTPHPQFYPPGFNSAVSIFQHYQNQVSQFAQAQHAARNATQTLAGPAMIPQARASNPITVNKMNIDDVARLPVAFGFQLNNNHSKALAQNATQTWSREGWEAIHATTRNNAPKPKPKNKTPRKSPTNTPNKIPRMSPVLISTPHTKTRGLPEGWTAKTYQRQGGSTVGSTDTYYYSPVTQIKFRSRNKIQIFVEIVQEVGGDEKKAFELFKERGHRV